MDSEAIKDLIENISQSVDNQIYLLREGLKNDKSSADILKFSANKLNRINHDIEQICSNHLPIMPKIHTKLHHSFEDFLTLKSKIRDTNDDAVEHSTQLLDLQYKVEMSKRKLKNIENLLEHLNICVPALQAYDNLMHDLNHGQYINSIDNLLKLENEYLPRVTHYSFTNKISESLPGIKDKIVNFALNQAKSFLSIARSAEEEIGRLTIAAIDAQISSNSNDISFDVFEKVDFSLMLTCDYVYSVLGNLNEFIDVYRPQRKQQLELCTTWTFKEVTVDNIEIYFKRCIGFFMIEDMLFQSVTQIVDLAFVHQLWDTACANISTVVRKILSANSSSKYIMAVKSKFKYLFKITKILNLSKQPLVFISTNLKSIYETHLSMAACERLSNELKRAVFQKVKVPTRKDFEYHLLVKQPEEFPVRFDFSKFAVSIANMSDQYLERIAIFMDGLANHPEENYIDVLESLKMLFVDKIPTAFLVGGVEQISFESLVQLTIDMSFFFNSIPNLCIKCAKYCKLGDTIVQSEFSADEMIHPVFLLIRTELMQRSHKNIRKMCEDSHLKSSKPNFDKLTKELESFLTSFIKSFENSTWKVCQFFVKKFFAENNSELLLQLKELLANDSIDAKIFAKYLKTVDTLRRGVLKSKHSEQLIVKFDRAFQALKIICESFTDWQWKNLIELYKTDPAIMTKDHIKLVKMILVHLDPNSLNAQEIGEKSAKDAIKSANAMLNEIEA